MTSNLYLYGTDDVPEIPAETVMRRIELLKDNLTEVMSKHYLDRDNEKKGKILRAIKFWETINESDS